MARWKKIVAIVPVLIAGLYFAWMTRGRAAPERVQNGEPALVVEVLTLETRSVTPRAIGYGPVRPGRTWRAVAEVSGRVIEVDGRLDAGEVYEAGALLLRIDPTDYELRVERLDAELQSAEAEVARLDVARENTAASLAVAGRTMDLAQRELQRLSSLDENLISRSAVELQEQAVLREEASVITLESALRTAGADEAVLQAKVASIQSQRTEAGRDLERTNFETPFECRVASKDVERGQYLAAGSVAFELDSIDVAEIEAQLAIERVRHLLRPEDRVEALQGIDYAGIWERLGITAVVRLRGEGFEFEWPARFARSTGGLDPKTRTVGLVAAVDDPYRGSALNKRPALVKGMFVEVEFRGMPLKERLVVPLAALHAGRVYLVDADDRLEPRDVEIEFVQFDEAVIASGLNVGETVVLTDVVPAIPGRLLAPRSAAR